jgi:eukaryotic-like serine/threonine-protein kinase
MPNGTTDESKRLRDPAPGTRVDDFTVAYRIRRGMNADTFAVWHHVLNAPLVCKRLRPRDAGDAKRRAMLRTEAEALAACAHPGVERLIEYRDGELPYLLLEHVGEQTLREVLLAEGRLAPDFAVRVLQHTGAALAYAHARGYLHRDLKPSNIILREGRPVLLDFGVAWKWRPRRRPPDRCGTPQYLAPEQVHRRRLAPATDIFGMGALLFELLTGRRAFRPGDPGDDASLEARYPQLVEGPLSFKAAGCGASRKLEQVIRRCLAADPADRFASVTELIVALDPFTRAKIWPQVKRRPGTLIGAAAR